MSGRHTSGPWQSRDDYTTDGFVTIIGNIDGEYVDGKPECTYDVICVCEDEYGERLPNVAANVRLVSAAPDLLEALQAFISWGTKQCPCENEEPNPCPLCGASVENLETCKAIEAKFPRVILTNARAAIAKALGEQS